jgi:hypothetical protein
VDVCIPSDSGKQCVACRSSGSPCDPGLECYNNRCYPSCTITLPNQCATCVQTQPDPPAGNGGGVCACPDQIVGPGASCLLASGVASCQPGTKCLSGVCQPRCDPNNLQTCPPGHLCNALFGDFYCTPDNSGQGGGTSGGGGSNTSGGRPTAGGLPVGGGAAGGGGVTVNNMGCACQGSSGGMVLVALASLVVMQRPFRRR